MRVLSTFSHQSSDTINVVGKLMTTFMFHWPEVRLGLLNEEWQVITFYLIMLPVGYACEISRKMENLGPIVHQIAWENNYSWPVL